jgi:glutathione S-transferase
LMWYDDGGIDSRAEISICDCMLFVMIEYWDPSFGSVITNDWFVECPWISGWYKRVGARPSAAANKINAAMAPTASL